VCVCVCACVYVLVRACAHSLPSLTGVAAVIKMDESVCCCDWAVVDSE